MMQVPGWGFGKKSLAKRRKEVLNREGKSELRSAAHKGKGSSFKALPSGPSLPLRFPIIRKVP